MPEATITANLITGGQTITNVIENTPVEGKVVTAGRGPKGDPGQSAVGLDIFNVLDYGAVGDGATDNRGAIQAALSAAAASHGHVFVPPLTFNVSGTLNLPSGVTMYGMGRSSVLRATDPNATLILDDNVSVLSEDGGLHDLQLKGTGLGTGTGRGVYLKQTGAGLVFIYYTLANLYINDFGGIGFEADSIIVSKLERVIVTSCGDGIYLNGHANGAWSSVNTSTALVACYANNIAGAGYHIQNTTYISFVACAADNCGIGYDIDESAAVTFIGTGCEYTADSIASPGIGWKIHHFSGQVGLFNCFLFQNKSIAVWATDTSTDVQVVGFCESEPLGSATASLQADGGSAITRIGGRLTTAIVGDVSEPIMSADAVTFRNLAGAALLGLSYYGTPVNYLDIEASPTAAAPSLAALGADTDISINLAPKGAGRVIIGSEYVVTPLSTDTLQNKTMSGTNNTFTDMAPKMAAGYHDADYPITAADCIILADPYAGILTMTLPTSTGLSGKCFTIKRMGSANNVVIATTGGQLVDGAGSYTLTAPYQSITVMSDGVNWNIIGKVG